MESESFWELHRRLGERYSLDLKGPVPPPANRTPTPPGRTTTPPTLWDSSPYRIPRHSISVPSPAGLIGTKMPSSQQLLNQSVMRSGSKPLAPNTPAAPNVGEEMPVMFLDSPDALWQSEAFLEDLQVLQKQQGDTLGAGGSPTEKSQTEGDTSEKGEDGEVPRLFFPRAFWSKSVERQASTSQELRTSASKMVTSKSRRALPTLPRELLLQHRAREKSTQCFHTLQNPNSTFTAWWGTIGVMLLSYDFVVIPLRAVGLEDSHPLTIMFWIAHLYWNAAIPLSFITGYDEDGKLVRDLRKTCKSYARSWFILDVALVSLDWIILALDSDGDSAGVARLSRTIRSLRFLRLLRLGRVVRLGSIIEALKDQLSSRMANIQYSILKIIFQLLIYNHIVACLWYGIGAEGAPDEGSWIEDLQLKERSVAVRYVTSLHWAYAQLGVGSTEIEAVNLNERIFSVVVSFMALLSFSSVISSMTSLLAALQKMKNDEIEQFTGLRKYLMHNNIDPDLSIRVTRFLKHSYGMKHKALSRDGNVAILDMLSKSLHEELQLQRHSECLQESDFLQMLSLDPSSDVFQVLCTLVTRCLQHGVCALDDVVFAQGTVATACFFISDGRCRYEHPALEGSMLAASRLSHVWVAEMCLWTPWLHAGDLVAQDISRVISVEVATFCDIMGSNQRVRKIASGYAMDFVYTLNEAQQWSDLNLANLIERDQRSASFHLPSPGTRRCCGGRIFKKIVPSG